MHLLLYFLRLDKTLPNVMRFVWHSLSIWQTHFLSMVIERSLFRARRHCPDSYVALGLLLWSNASLEEWNLDCSQCKTLQWRIRCALCICDCSKHFQIETGFRRWVLPWLMLVASLAFAELRDLVCVFLARKFKICLLTRFKRCWQFSV